MWLIYALGGGWGHLTRSIALARIAQRNRPVRILSNSPYASIAANSLPSLDLVMLNARAPAGQTRAAVAREIAKCRPACLIVDTFPRGIGGELAGILGTLAARKVLVHRDLNPRYVAAASLRTFVAAHYDLVLAPGAGEGSQLGNPPPTVETRPWLVRCAGEMPAQGEVKGLLRLGSHEERSVLVCASGKEKELAWYGAVVSHLRNLDPSVPVRCVAPECPPSCPNEFWVRHWPAMELFRCASVVVGGAGYNTVQECLAWRVCLVARAWPRAYDRQELRAQRASRCGRVLLVQDAEDAARTALAEFGDPPGRPGFINGAEEAVERIRCTGT